MKNFLKILGISLLLNSCVTANRCNDKFPPISSDSIVVSIRDTTIIIDTVSVYITDTFTSSSLLLDDFINYIINNPSDDWKDIESSIYDTGEKKSSIQYKGDSLRALCKNDSLKIIIQGLQFQLQLKDKDIYHYEQLYVDEKQKYKQLKLQLQAETQRAKGEKWNSISKVFKWIAIGLSVLALLGFIIKLRKK